MLIGALSARTSVSTRAPSLRKLGMLRSDREENGYPNYAEESVEWVKSIQFLLSFGLNLATMAEMLPILMGDSVS
jgi:DNA-binding transcriptional MerR regulator